MTAGMRPTLTTVAQDEAEFTFPMITGLLCHKEAVTAVLIGRRLGLTVTHEHNGGWIDRYHLITARGDADAVRRYVDIYNQWVRQLHAEEQG